MTDSIFLSPEGFARVKAMHRLQTVLQREGKGYLRTLHARCGVGMTNEQFDNIVRVLAHNGLCNLKEGALGATLVVFNEAFSAVKVPELITGPDQHNETR
jgi:hypothetical protein